MSTHYRDMAIQVAEQKFANTLLQILIGLNSSIIYDHYSQVRVVYPPEFAESRVLILSGSGNWPAHCEHRRSSPIKKGISSLLKAVFFNNNQ